MPTNALYALAHRFGQIWDPPSGGGVGLAVHTALPTAGVGVRGVPMRTEGGAGVADTVGIPLKNASDTYTTYYPVLSTSANNGSAGLRETVVDTGGAFATPIVLTAGDTGKTYLLDDAAGLDFTLPAIAAADVGIKYRFLVQVEPTSNSYRFTAQAADLLLGRLVIIDKDMVEGSTEAVQQLNRPDGTDDLILTITGTDDTQGSLVGGSFTIEAITATRWWVEGVLIGDGALATNFS
jgi:hypothetical protein